MHDNDTKMLIEKYEKIQESILNPTSQQDVDWHSQLTPIIDELKTDAMKAKNAKEVYEAIRSKIVPMNMFKTSKLNILSKLGQIYQMGGEVSDFLEYLEASKAKFETGGYARDAIANRSTKR